MKKLLILAWFVACSEHVYTLQNSQSALFKVGLFCGDDCDGSCKSPMIERPELEKPEIAK